MKTLLFLIPMMTSTAFADELVSARNGAMGEFGASDAVDTTAMFINPSVIALEESYDVVALFSAGSAKRLRWGLAAADASSNEAVSFGLAYIGDRDTPDFLTPELPGWEYADEVPENFKFYNDVHATIALPFLNRRLSVGIGGLLRFYNTTWNDKGVTGNLNLGVSGQPVEWLTIGASVRDILPIPDQYDRPATLSFGVSAATRNVYAGYAEADFLMEQTSDAQYPWRARAGGEVAISSVLLRAGYSWDGPTNVHQIHAGVGLFSQTGSIEYGIRLPVAGAPLTAQSPIHFVSVTLNTASLRKDAPNSAMEEWSP